jgi:hypothetical protein
MLRLGRVELILSKVTGLNPRFYDKVKVSPDMAAVSTRVSRDTTFRDTLSALSNNWAVVVAGCHPVHPGYTTSLRIGSSIVLAFSQIILSDSIPTGNRLC